eukprot:RCo055684
MMFKAVSSLLPFCFQIVIGLRSSFARQLSVIILLRRFSIHCDCVRLRRDAISNPSSMLMLVLPCAPSRDLISFLFGLVFGGALGWNCAVVFPACLHVHLRLLLCMSFTATVLIVDCSFAFPKRGNGWLVFARDQKK